jgi:hypothetical protein
MMELTIMKLQILGGWLVTNKHPVFSKIISIWCDTFEEAMETLQQLNGQTYEVIHAFQKARQRLG